MLDLLWEKLKPSGILLYATCSILPEENEKQIENFVRRHDDVNILEIPKAQGLGHQVFPGEQNMDGFYYAKLSKMT